MNTHTTNIQISQSAVEQRAQQRGMAQARAELQAEAAQAQRAQEQQDFAARAHYNETIERARGQLAELEKDYAKRAALALELGPKAVEIIQLTNSLQQRIFAIYEPALHARAHVAYLDEPQFRGELGGQQDVFKALGGSALETHLRTHINATDDTEQWSAFLLALLTRGTLAIGTSEGKRNGYINGGNGTTIVLF